MSLFDQKPSNAPLASRVRPNCLGEYVGQKHLIGPGRSLSTAIENGALHSMILWGPPGVGKTTFANLLAHQFDVFFSPLSAVLSGVKDIRATVEEAKMRRNQSGRDTLLFVDEVHRFNKSQQDAFLPYVEDGTVIFVGATTENPSFELNNALLSRARVYVLKNLNHEELIEVINNALVHPEGFSGFEIEIHQNLIEILAHAANGDARKALNFLELAIDLSPRIELNDRSRVSVSEDEVQEVLQSSLKRFDKGGDIFYEQISALHKSVRGSDPDASLYWMVRMLDGGCDPLYIARRIVRMASEDIGNADPRALQLAMSAWDVQERLGSPEGELALAQAVIFLAVAPKSNAVYKAFNECRRFVSESSEQDVPCHLRNAPTQLMKEQGMGEDYRYAHDEPEGFAAGESYFPEAFSGVEFYSPVDRGLELKISDRLRYVRQLNKDAVQQRYAK